jgi:hypothetical protein
VKIAAGSPGIFSGADYANQGAGALPGKGMTLPKPPKPLAPAPRPIQPQAQSTTPIKPAAPTQTPAAPATGGFDLSNLRSPQMFGMLAGALRPVTQSVMQYGGMPALAAIYGMFTGNKDWSTAMSAAPNNGIGTNLTKMPQQQPTVYSGGPVGPMKTASFRLPLPVADNNELKMPTFVKAAWGNGTRAAGPNMAPAYKGPNPFNDIVPTAPTPEASAPGSNSGQVLKHFGTQLAAYEGTRRGLEQTAKAISPGVVTKAPGLRGGFGVDTAVNIGGDLLDLAGIRSTDGSKPHSFWEKPVLDAKGLPVLDAKGMPKAQTGWNPKAFGWDMKHFDRGTTVDGKSMLGGQNNNYASYAGAALHGYQHPLKGLYSMGKFQYKEMNPLVDLASGSGRKAWGDVLSGEGAKDVGGKSIPLTVANNAVTRPWMPDKEYRAGGSMHQTEAKIWKDQDKYHPVYNRDGKKGRPMMAGRWWDQLTH